MPVRVFSDPSRIFSRRVFLLSAERKETEILQSPWFIVFNSPWIYELTLTWQSLLWGQVNMKTPLGLPQN
jgi:hypothetical protein